ncbi:MAG: N-6 DNA methylase, partial [Bacillota bacterium]
EQKIAYNIFHGTLSADNLDGITRAARSIGLPAPEPMRIISGISKKGELLILSPEVQPIVFDFFELQKKVYLDYVYSSNGLSAEAMMTRALEITFPKSSSDRNEFLSLDDHSTLERCNEDHRSRELVRMLDEKKLFASLREIAPEKYKLISALRNRIHIESGQSIATMKALEATLSDTLNLPEPAYFICHSTIRHKFHIRGLRQSKLFTKYLSLEEVNRDLRSSKSYESLIDMFLPQDNISNLRLLSIPNSLRYPIAFENSKLPLTTELEKHRGAYTTPRKVAQFLANWAIQERNAIVLDPASGEGVFLKSAYERMIDLGASSGDAINAIYGIETDRVYWQKSLHVLGEHILSSKRIINDDFFNISAKAFGLTDLPKYDAVIANPPYIRAHRFQGDDRQRALLIAEQCGIRLSQRVSSWAPYVIYAATMLKPNGRMGMVLPTELLSTDYADPVRRFLRKHFTSLQFIFFDKFVFAGVQQDVVLLLASNDGPQGILRTSVQDKDALLTDTISNIEIQAITSKWLSCKWTSLLTDQYILSLIDRLIDSNKVVSLGELATVSIGQVTGCNDFFIISQPDAAKNSIKEEWLTPIVAKAASIPGAICDSDEFQMRIASGAGCYLLRINTSANVASDPALMEYLKEGKRRGVEQKYKCRTRWPWYSVPMQTQPDAFITYMSGNFVRLVLNKAQIHSTNTIHNIRFREDINKHMVSAYIAAFYSSFSLLSTELMGRVYGGGVLKLELGDTKKILLPNLDTFKSEYIERLTILLIRLDKAIRSGSLDICCEIDHLVMHEGLGLSESDCSRIREE